MPKVMGNGSSAVSLMKFYGKLQLLVDKCHKKLYSVFRLKEH